MAIHEEKVLLSNDRLCRVAIVRRPDGLFCLYSRAYLSIDVQKELGFRDLREMRWTTDYDPAFYEDSFDDEPASPLRGLYGSVEEAEVEARHILKLDGG